MHDRLFRAASRWLKPKLITACANGIQRTSLLDFIEPCERMKNDRPKCINRKACQTCRGVNISHSENWPMKVGDEPVRSQRLVLSNKAKMLVIRSCFSSGLTHMA
jgi:hypothetical protein